MNYFVIPGLNMPREISMAYIQKVVCEYFNIPPEMLQLNTRKREVVQARQISMTFCKRMVKKSLAEIGTAHAGRDHATVLHAVETVSNLYDTERVFASQIDEIEKRIKNIVPVGTML